MEGLSQQVLRHGLQFRRVLTQILPNFQLHAVNFHQKTKAAAW